MRIRAAEVREHAVLSRIARQAKAHWGYPAGDLVRWQAELTVSPDSIVRLPTFVAEIGAEPAGFAQLLFAPDGPELEHLWVLPAHMGSGVGRALLERALQEVADRGYGSLLIDADPHAEGFYLACGAVRIGARAAPAIGQPERVRPLLVLPAHPA